MDSLSLHQGIFLIQELNWSLLCCRQILLPSESPGKPINTGVGSLSLHQGIFPTLELNPGLLHCRWILHQLSYRGSPDGTSGKKNLPASVGDVGSIPGLEDPLEEGMATHSNILAWRIPWTEKPGRLQSIFKKLVNFII